MLSPLAAHPLSASWPWIHTGIAIASPTASTPSGCVSVPPPPNLAHGGGPRALHRGRAKG